MASIRAELKPRNVIRVAIAYAVVSRLLIEISATLLPMPRLPEWTATSVAVLLVIGFPEQSYKERSNTAVTVQLFYRLQ